LDGIGAFDLADDAGGVDEFSDFPGVFGCCGFGHRAGGNGQGAPNVRSSRLFEMVWTDHGNSLLI